MCKECKIFLRRRFYEKKKTSTSTPWEEIDGSEVSTYTEQRGSPWTVGGENCIYVCYLGAETVVPVEIVPSDVGSIEVTKSPDKTVYESTYYPICIGAEVTVIFKDSTSKVIAVNEDNVVYSDGGQFGYLLRKLAEQLLRTLIIIFTRLWILQLNFRIVRKDVVIYQVRC